MLYKKRQKRQTKTEYNIQKGAVAKKNVQKKRFFATAPCVILSYIEMNTKNRKSDFKFYADIIF